MCVNTSAINSTKNPDQHFITKHTKIRHHFTKYHTKNSDCEIKFIKTTNQLAYLFTKPLTKERFNFLTIELGILDMSYIS